LKNEFQVEKKIGRALLFAPERALTPLWKSALGLQAIRTDIEAARGVDILSDLMQLPFASECVDLIWCHHVLEQVEDDRVALRELYRVLLSGGELLISAGLTGQKETQELGHANKRLSGNRRLYGSDFRGRLEEAGFQVTPLTYNLSAEELERYAIKPEVFYHCTKSLDA
jgi:ubiquinone/menaquinone biosynthesis C-methylase UbiE